MTTTYVPSAYWDTLVAGDGELSNVGHPNLGDYNRFAYRRRMHAMQRSLAVLPGKPGSVFEAAFGAGFYLSHWDRTGVEIVAGMDLAHRAVEAACRRYPDSDLRCGDLSDSSGFAGFGHYDFVTAVDVLYHVTDDGKWEAALDNLLPLVADGGHFLFTDKLPEGEPWQNFEHVRRRPLSMWSAVLARHGFEVVRITPAFVFMDDPIPSGEHPLLGRISMLQWRIVTKVLRTTQGAPALQGLLARIFAGLQILPEKLLTSTLSRVPNLEYVLCRKIV